MCFGKKEKPQPRDSRDAVSQLENDRPRRVSSNAGPRRTPSNTSPRRTPSNTGPRRTPSNTGPRRTPSNTGPRRTPRRTTGSTRPAPNSTDRIHIPERSELAGNSPESHPGSEVGGGAPSRPQSQGGNPEERPESHGDNLGGWLESQGGSLEEWPENRGSSTEDRRSHGSAEATVGIESDYQIHTRTPGLNDDELGRPSGPGAARVPDVLANSPSSGTSTVVKGSRSGEAATPVEGGNKGASNNWTWPDATADSCGGPPSEWEGPTRDRILGEVQDTFDHGAGSEVREEYWGAYDLDTNTCIQSRNPRGNFDSNTGSYNIYGNGNSRVVFEGARVGQFTVANMVGVGGTDGLGNAAVAAREEVQHVPWMVTYCRNKGFTGRKGILEKVESQAQMGDHNRVALWGLGGTGKTQIALRYVYQYEKKRPVFWVHGSSLEKFSEEFMRIIPYAGISQTTTDGKDGESPLASVKKWFESSGSGDWILVVDNADNESDFEGNSSPIAKYIPRCSKGTLIITTRSKQVASRLGCHGDSAIEVKRMNSKEAMKLFFSRHAALECQEDRWAVKDILRSLHYLPLAVVGAAAYMTETSTVPSVYLAMFNSEDSAKRLLSRKFDDIYREAPSGMPESILSTFFITFEQIKKLDHLAMELLQLITFLKDHQNILEGVLRCSDLEGMSDPIAARDAIGKLESYSLLTKTPSSAGGPSQPVYEFHRLVQISAEVYIREREGLEVSRWVNMAEKAELASRRQSSFVSSSLREQPNPGIEQPGLGGS